MLILPGERTGRYTFDPRTARYRDRRTGFFVSRQQIRHTLDSALDAASEEAERVALQLQRGQVSLGQFQTRFAALVKQIHLYSAAVATGGWDRMTAEHLGTVGAKLKGEYAYLKRLVEQVASRQQPLDGRFLNRVRMYVQQGRNTHHAVEIQEMRARGFDEYRNVLNQAAQHCTGCVNASRAGWAPIGTLTPIGRRDCLSRCKCRWIYRNSETGQVAG